MTQEWTGIIPLPPSANHCYRVARKRVIKSKAYVNWQFIAGLMLGKPTPVHGPVKVELLVHMGRKWNHKRDIDNLIKPVVDLVKSSGVIPDDNSRIVREVSIKFSDEKTINGSVTIFVKSLEVQQCQIM